MQERSVKYSRRQKIASKEFYFGLLSSVFANDKVDPMVEVPLEKNAFLAIRGEKRKKEKKTYESVDMFGTLLVQLLDHHCNPHKYVST